MSLQVMNWTPRQRLVMSFVVAGEHAAEPNNLGKK
jgi:hypothetical protein